MAPSYLRGKQTARQFKVLQLLENSRFGLTTRELRDEVVEELGLGSLHEKTIRRDVQHWRNLGYPIQQLETSNPERPKIWKLDRNNLKVPKLPIGVVELLAFSAARELLYPLAGTPYWDGIQRMWERMRDSTSADVLEHLDRQRAGLIVRGPMPKNYARQEGMLSSLNRAVFEHRLAAVRYKGADQPRARLRRLQPHAVCLFHNSIYVLAVDADEEEGPVKTYKLDRMRSVQLLDRRFTPRKDFDPEAFFDNSIGIFRSGKPRNFRIRVDAQRADIAVEQLLHPRQQVKVEEDGAVVIEIEGAYEEEILPIVLSLGRHAEVLVPKSSRAKLAEIARQLVRTYR
ncbi:MAG: WYL domain-containing protein [Planctomycetales bacterium]|nr:WYL domain-containing protein [Planctomycetales bacterium]